MRTCYIDSIGTLSELWPEWKGNPKGRSYGYMHGLRVKHDWATELDWTDGLRVGHNWATELDWWVIHLATFIKTDFKK